MELDQFVELASEKPLTAQQKAWLAEIQELCKKHNFKVTPTGRYVERRSPTVADVFFHSHVHGRKADQAILDGLIVTDFSHLEDLSLAALMQTGSAITRQYFDERDRLIREHVKPEDIYVFSSDPRLMQMPPMPQRGMSKSLLNARAWKAALAEKPIDHPSRKREPKGPRGKWGKLK